MDKHGSETYFVLGEGLLGESVGGRMVAAAANAATTATTAAAATAASAPPFRFTRMGPTGKGHQIVVGARRRLAEAMVAGGGGDSQVPAGFTYLGQFIDHDMTFDRTNVTLGTNVSATRLLQGRSPSLDLDSLYGAGPQDPASARFYETDGLHLKLGRTVAAEGIAAMDGFDLPRGEGTGAAAKRRAVIPDARNDENLAVAQTHLAMIRFHNRVLDTLPGSVPQAQRFAKARELVTKHYQWMIRTDYLPRICAGGKIRDVFGNGRKVFEASVSPTDVPTMPIEFSVAAFRLGHSMVRRAYDWNIIFDDGLGSLELLFTFSGTGGNLGGDARLPSSWIADFRRLYDFRDAGRANLAPPTGGFNRAMRIDTLLVDPLKNLPAGTFGGPEVPPDDQRANLAFRNLERANMVRLATGQQMVTFMRSKGVTVTRLSRAQVRDGKDGAVLDGLTGGQRDAVLENTPLWFYLLREAEFNRGRLDGVGARIVAETFHRAMEGSQSSIVRDAGWRPSLGPDDRTFRMVDLLLFAFEGKKKLLAPLG